MNFKLIPILSAILLLACSPNTQTAQTVQNQPAITTNAECKNLHKVTDIDDLLYQMYTNIDSHCLFEMPTAELEKIWGIPIFDSVPILKTYPNNYNEQKLLQIASNRMEFEKERYGLFLEKRIDIDTGTTYFLVLATVKYIERNHGWGGSVYTGYPPTRLPNPKYFSYQATTTASPNSYTFNIFQWVNSSGDRMKPLLQIQGKEQIIFYENFLMFEHSFFKGLPLTNSFLWRTYHGK